MTLKDKLEIFLITYNRKENLNNTLKQILAENSPIRSFDITIIDNKSDDGTSELIKEYQKYCPNIKHIINNRNIGGNANAARAYELATKEYVWVLCDDDQYDFSHWDEVERGILKNKADAIILTSHKTPRESIEHLIISMTFVPGVIWKTENITSTVMVNAYYLVNYYFPQLALGIYLVNNNKKIFLTDYSVVNPRPVPIDTTYTYTRGLDKDKSNNMSNTIWGVGVLNALDLLHDKKLKERIIDEFIFKGRKELRPSYLVKFNKKNGNNSLKNLTDAFCAYSLKNRLKLIYYYILVNLKGLFASKKDKNEQSNKIKSKRKSNKKINIPICFVADTIYAKYMGVTMQSIIANSKKNEFFTFYIFNSDLTPEIKTNLGKICKNKAVVKYIDTSAYQSKFDALQQKAEHITKTSYFKFIIPDLLPDLDKVIYLDCDLVVVDSLAGLYNEDVSDYLFAAVEDVGYAYWKEKRDNFLLNYKVINSGVMLFNMEKCRKENLSSQLFAVASHPEVVGKGQDQPVFNYVCKDKIKFVDYRYNMQDTFWGQRVEMNFRFDYSTVYEARKHPVIVHYTGINKPWKVPFVSKGECFWKYYLNSPFMVEELKKKYIPLSKKLIRYEFLSNLRKYKKKEIYQKKLRELRQIKNFDVI